MKLTLTTVTIILIIFLLAGCATPTPVPLPTATLHPRGDVALYAATSGSGGFTVAFDNLEIRALR